MGGIRLEGGKQNAEVKPRNHERRTGDDVKQNLWTDAVDVFLLEKYLTGDEDEGIMRRR